MLHHLAESAHGWPDSAEFATFEDSRDAAVLHADAFADYRSEDETTHAAAQESLYWVADHLAHLWD